MIKNILICIRQYLKVSFDSNVLNNRRVGYRLNIYKLLKLLRI